LYFSSFIGVKKGVKPKKIDKYALEQEHKIAKDDLKKRIWLVYKNYRKGHGMLSW